MLQTFLDNPELLSSYSFKQLKQLSSQLRFFLHNQEKHLKNVDEQSLDIIELVLVLHKVFDAKQDIVLFENHQFKSLYDLFVQTKNAHVLFSLTAAYAHALLDKDHHIVSVIDHQSLAFGDVYEALHHIGQTQKKVILVYFDNQLESYKSTGIISQTFSAVRTSKAYTHLKKDVKGLLQHSKVGHNVLRGLSNVKESLKDVITPQSIFDELNIEYLGPIEATDLKLMSGAFNLAKNHDGPIVIHIKTQPKTGENNLDKTSSIIQKTSYETLIEQKLLDSLANNDSFVVLTSYNHHFDTLEKAMKKKKQSFIHAASPSFIMSLATTLASNQQKVVVILNSHEIEQASVVLHHENSLDNGNISLFISNVGINYDQNPVFNVFDLSVLSSINHGVIAHTKDEKEAFHLMHTAMLHEGFFALRFSNHPISISEHTIVSKLPIGSWTIEYSHPNAQKIVICYGEMVSSLSSRAKSNELEILVINARFIEPIDTELLTVLANKNIDILVYESDDKTGGLYLKIVEFYKQENRQVSLERVGIEKPLKYAFSTIQIKKENKIDTNSLIEIIQKGRN